MELALYSNVKNGDLNDDEEQEIDSNDTYTSDSEYIQRAKYISKLKNTD